MPRRGGSDARCHRPRQRIEVLDDWRSIWTVNQRFISNYQPKTAAVHATPDPNVVAARVSPKEERLITGSSMRQVSIRSSVVPVLRESRRGDDRPAPPLDRYDRPSRQFHVTACQTFLSHL